MLSLSRQCLGSDNRSGGSSQQRSAAQAGPFVCAEVLVSDNEQQDDGVNEVGKGKVEGPKNTGAAGVGSDLVEGGLCVGDLARERGQGLFEVGGFALKRLASWRARASRAEATDLPGPKGHHFDSGERKSRACEVVKGVGAIESTR